MSANGSYGFHQTSIDAPSVTGSGSGTYWRGFGEGGFRFTPSFVLSATGGYENFSIDGSSFIKSPFVGLSAKFNFSTNKSSSSGDNFWVSFEQDFYAFPELKFGVFAGFSKFNYSPEDFAKRIDVGLSIKYSFSKGIFAKNVVEIDESETDPIFPVFYSYYNENPFGSLVLFNGEENKITDVTVSVLVGEYMPNPKICASFEKIEQNEVFTAPLTAFLNETILESLLSHKTEGKIIVSYRSLGKRVTSEQILDFTALRNI